MSMASAEMQDLLRMTLGRIGRIGGLAAQTRDYFIDLVRRAADVAGVGSVFLRINQRDDEQAVDHLMEIKYGLFFRDLHFLIRFEPTGTRGPDLMVERDGVQAFVEVKRYRPKEGEGIAETLGPHGTLPPYGGNPSHVQDRIEEELPARSVRSSRGTGFNMESSRSGATVRPLSTMSLSAPFAEYRPKRRKEVFASVSSDPIG